jgi:hypothetical protein
MTFLGSARRFSVSYYLHILKNRRQGQLSKILYFSGRKDNLKITKVAHEKLRYGIFLPWFYSYWFLIM